MQNRIVQASRPQSRQMRHSRTGQNSEVRVTSRGRKNCFAKLYRSGLLLPDPSDAPLLDRPKFRSAGYFRGPEQLLCKTVTIVQASRSWTCQMPHSRTCQNSSLRFKSASGTTVLQNRIVQASHSQSHQMPHSQTRQKLPCICHTRICTFACSRICTEACCCLLLLLLLPRGSPPSAGNFPGVHFAVQYPPVAQENGKNVSSTAANDRR